MTRRLLVLALIVLPVTHIAAIWAVAERVLRMCSVEIGEDYYKPPLRS